MIYLAGDNVVYGTKEGKMDVLRVRLTPFIRLFYFGPKKLDID